MSTDIIIYIITFVFGLIFGSFFNVVGYRLPNEESIVFPASHCPKCKHKLKFYELVPVFSYIFLGGKCKVCKKRISFIYPLFELITASLFTLSYYVFGLSIEFVFAITIISTLIIVTISDIRYYIIPDEVLIIGSILLVIEYIIKMFITSGSAIDIIFMPILNGLASFAILYLLKVLGDALFKKESLGGGDIKLLFFIGLSLGFDMSIISVFLAAFLALPYSIYTLSRKDIEILPFGPYLSLSAVILLLFQMNLDKVLLIFN